MKIVRAIATVGGFTMLSRVFGLVRDVVIAAFLGAGPVADAFFVAFRFPNFFRRLFAEGAMNASFVPIFSRLHLSGGMALARQAAEQVFAVLFISLVLFVILTELGLPWLMYFLAPGFMDRPEQFDLALYLTRLTFPYILFVSLASFYGGILNSLGKFSAAAASPVLLNVAMILALLVGHVAGFVPVWSLAWSIPLAGLVQFFWMRHACHRQAVVLRFVAPSLTPAVRQLLRAMGPGAIGAGIMQINLLVDTMLASLLPTGAVSYLYYADRLNQLPLSLLGIGISTVLLPVLSRQFEAGDIKGANNTQNRTLEYALAFALPASFALVALAQPVISVIFEREEFTGADVRETAMVLCAFSCGLPAWILIRILSTAFFARYDTRTPVRTAIVSMIVNILLNLVLMFPFKHVGIALATTLTAWLNAGILILRLYRGGALLPDARLGERLPRILGAALLMALSVYGFGSFLDMGFSVSILSRVLKLTLLVIGGGVLYLALVVGFRGIIISEIRGWGEK